MVTGMDNSPAEKLVAAQILESTNAIRAIRGLPALETLPERYCSFCGGPKEDVGALVQGIGDSAFICRTCTAEAQHAFLRAE